jgi:hypothetical protein
LYRRGSPNCLRPTEFLNQPRGELVYSTRLELNSIQSRWREPHYEERNQSRAGDIAPSAQPQLARAALIRNPAGLYSIDQLPLHERVVMLTQLSGTGEPDQAWLDYRL